jgi:mannose-6-phosphate isomerase
MTALAEALRDPIALTPNRIPRFYRGGRLLGGFLGSPNATDDDRPEDWVGSATRIWTRPSEMASSLGPSSVTVGSERLSLAEVLEREPEALVGDARAHSLGLLVKLLDAGERLPVHCHPTRAAATRLLGSPFGKTEAWLILGTRDDEPSARIWAGFKSAVAPSVLRTWIERQRTDALLDALVEHPVSTGDVFLIPAGMPHAIGAGIFLLELQEPTDFSIVAETRGFPITDADASLGLGWDAAIDFFETDAAADPRQQPVSLGGGVARLLGDAADPYFGALRIDARGEMRLPISPTYAVGVVLAGSGEINGPSRALPLRAGTTFALPAAAVPKARITAPDGLQLVLCLPASP